MSLRTRLTLIVSMLFLAGMLLGLAFLASNARQRVSEEVDAAALLAWQLLDSAVFELQDGTDGGERARLDARLDALADVRHLDIGLASEPRVETGAAVTGVPAWFVYLVRHEPVEYRVPLGIGGEAIVIRSNAADEIAEVWRETRNFLVVLALVLLFLNGLLHFTLGRWLAPVSAIVSGLEGAEQGDFSGHVSQASLPELREIAEKLNQLTVVLRTSKQENAVLRHRALVIQEEERQHLARELHDEMGQSITAIKAIAFSIAGRTGELDPVISDGAARIGAICNQVSGHVRRLMHRLRPPLLDELGLVPALQAMIDEWNKTHRDTFCSFRANGDFSGLDAERQIGLYRIVQEALTNVARHAGAERVDVQLVHGEGYRLEIADDGRGYDAGEVRAGMGMNGIRERCEALGGHLQVQTAPGAGVRIAVGFDGGQQA